jgi:hypothetical protein
MELVSGELVTPSDRSIDRYARRASGIVVTNGVGSVAVTHMIDPGIPQKEGKEKGRKGKAALRGKKRQ